jgi:hypothetical protein
VQFLNRYALLVLLGTACSAACGSNSTPTTPAATTTASQPSLTVSSSALAFGPQALGSSSGGGTVSLGNSGPGTINIASITVTGDFTETDSCGTSMLINVTCVISITFTPTIVGTRTGTLTVSDNAAGSPHVVALSGVGGSGQVLLQPANLVFPSLVVGASYGSSAGRTLTVTNNGAQVNVSSITTTGDFTQTNSCGTAVAAANACLITVVFAPSATGSRTGVLIINDDAPGSPHTAVLTGTGLPPAATVSFMQSTQVFGNQTIGTTSAPASIQFTNLGSAILGVTGITTTGDFAQTNSCGTSILQAGICTVNVTFTPTAAGIRTGTITVLNNSPGGPQSMVLSGTGTSASSGSGPLVGLSPTGLTFAAQPIGSPGPLQTVTLTNTGAAALAISNVAASGDFSQGNTCGSALAAGRSCAINVAFTPTAVGTRTGTLTITDSAPGSPHAVFLTGTGTSIAPAVTLSPSSIVFGIQPLGVASSTITASVINSGGTTLTISSLSISGEFSETDTCKSPIPAGGSCTVNVVFAPSAVGTRTGSITIVDSAASSPQMLALSGTGVSGEVVTMSPAALVFGSQTVGTTSAAQSFTITNSGALTVTLLSITAGGDFAQTNTCGGTLAAGASCTVNVTYTPSATGSGVGAVTIVDDAPGSPHTVILTGSGS